MAFEPAFATKQAAWPLAGTGAFAGRSDEPDLAIPRGVLLPFSPHDGKETEFPAHADAGLTTPPGEPLDVSRTAKPDKATKWKAAVLCSCLLHAVVALAFLAAPDGRVLIEGAEDSGITMAGNAAEDQLSSGEIADLEDATRVTLVTMLQPRPAESVAALAVDERDAVEATEPVASDAEMTETVEPEPQAEMPAQSLSEVVEPEIGTPAAGALAPSLPQILAADTIEPAQDSTVVSQVEAEPEAQDVSRPPAAIEIPLPDVADEPLAAISPDQAALDEPLPDDVPVPSPRPTPVARTEKPATGAAQEPKPQPAPKKQPGRADTGNSRAGNGGANATDSKRGRADGQQQGSASVTGKAGQQSAPGNAAVSNYPGKVAAKLRRAVRGVPASARRQARNDVHVSFVVSASGEIASARILRSSGSAELDEAALAVVRRAAPFPPIPPEAGRSNWSFALPLGLAR